MKPRAPFLGAFLGALLGFAAIDAPALAQFIGGGSIGASGGGSSGVAASVVCLLTDCIMTSQTVYSGVTDDVVSASGQALTLKAQGAAALELQGGTSGTSTINLRNVSGSTVGTLEPQSNLTMTHTVAAAGSFMQLQGSGGWVRIGAKTNLGGTAPVLAVSEALTTDLIYFWGDGSLSVETAVTSLASGDCDANGEVGRIWKYTKNTNGDINLCACAKQAGAFAFKALTAGGDCT